MDKNRVKALYLKDERTGCWRLLPGAPMVIRFDGKLVRVYQLLWRFVIGTTVPPGHVLRRTCEDRRCVSPHHRALARREGSLAPYR